MTSSNKRPDPRADSDLEEPPLSGFLVIDKPLGLSSFGVVARVRRAARRAKTGHAGTLDPLATGILVLAIGRATRAISSMMDADKHYQTEIDLSAFTTTDDAEGERAEVAVPVPPDRARVVAELSAFQGIVQQRPPAFSAMKVGGRRAYQMARAGAAPELPPRPVRIDRIELLRYDWPLVEIDVRCGKGTYIRSIARDLGVALRTGGHCRSLRRLGVGPFTTDRAMSLADVPERLRQEDLIDVDAALTLLSAHRSPPV